MEKIVKIRVNGSNLDAITTSATTFGELKTQLTNVDWGNKKVIVRQTRVTLESDDAHLPTTNFDLYLYNNKQKAGASYDIMGYHDLRKACINNKNITPKNKANSNYGTVDEMRKSLNAAEGKTEVVESDSKETIYSVISSMKSDLDTLKKMVADLNEGVVDEEIIAFEAEYDEISKQLKLK